MFPEQNWLAEDGQEIVWDVPETATFVKIEVWGAGNFFSSQGVLNAAHGGYASAYFDVSTTLQLVVCPGTSYESTGSGGGVAGNIADGGSGDSSRGGSAGSYVRPGPIDLDKEISKVWIVAGGSGGVGITNDFNIYAAYGGGDNGQSIPGILNGTGANQVMAGSGGNGERPGSSGNLGNGGSGPSGGGGGFWGGGSGAGEGEYVLGSGGGGSGGFPSGAAYRLTIPAPINVSQTSQLYKPNPSGNASGYVRITDASNFCVSEHSLVSISNQFGENVQVVKIRDVRPGMFVTTMKGELIEVKKVVKFRCPVNEIIEIAEYGISLQSPSSPLHILAGHPIWIDNREVLPEFLVATGKARMVILEKPVFVYCLLTERRTFCNIQDLFIGTWSLDAFQNIIDNEFVTEFELQ